jgi:hypothetical protein
VAHESHTSLEQHNSHSQDLRQESSPITIKESQEAKVSDGAVQAFTDVKRSLMLSCRCLPTFPSSALEVKIMTVFLFAS